MFYLIIALINAVFGILMILTTSTDTPGFLLVVFIASVLSILGLVGVALWIWHAMTDDNKSQSQIALKNWFQVTRGVDILLILGLLFRSFVLQPFLVDGNSMEPNYHNREFLLVDRITYRFRAPQRGEVIIFRFPKNPQSDYIKRIIGLPSETVSVKEGQVYINNELLDEPYLDQELTFPSGGAQVETKTLGQDEYFVMGDNRSNSSDSREWGSVPGQNIIGRSWFVIYPLNYAGKVQNPAYNLNGSSFSMLTNLATIALKAP